MPRECLALHEPDRPRSVSFVGEQLIGHRGTALLTILFIGRFGQSFRNWNKVSARRREESAFGSFAVICSRIVSNSTRALPLRPRHLAIPLVSVLNRSSTPDDTLFPALPACS